MPTRWIRTYLVAAKLTPDAVLSHHTTLEFHGRAYSVWQHFIYSAERPAETFILGTDPGGRAGPSGISGSSSNAVRSTRGGGNLGAEWNLAVPEEVLPRSWEDVG